MSDNAAGGLVTARLHSLAAQLGPLPDGTETAGAPRLTPAAVLVGVRGDPGGWGSVVLMQRAHHPGDPHSGQVALPGGKIDPGDGDAVTAARREAAEEIGLPEAQAHLLGALAPYDVRTGFRIHPIVAAIPPGFRGRPEAGEVAAVFDLPLGRLLTPGAFWREARDYGGERVPFYVLGHEAYRIWGATAGILADLASRLRACAADSEGDATP